MDTKKKEFIGNFENGGCPPRCQVHRLRNILDHLPEHQRPGVQAIVRRAHQATDVKTATRLLTNLAKRLEDEYPSAAGASGRGSTRR